MEPHGRSIYDRIGYYGTWKISAAATPWPFKLSAPFYGFWVYRNMLKESADADELLSLHRSKYSRSPVFRLLRPSYGKIKQLLNEVYEIG